MSKRCGNAARPRPIIRRQGGSTIKLLKEELGIRVDPERAI
jgi:hypothetical protein